MLQRLWLIMFILWLQDLLKFSYLMIKLLAIKLKEVWQIDISLISILIYNFFLISFSMLKQTQNKANI